jgi:hypothetical protein
MQPVILAPGLTQSLMTWASMRPPDRAATSSIALQKAVCCKLRERRQTSAENAIAGFILTAWQ